MGAGREAAIIFGKELRAELRTRELLHTTVIFAVMVVVLFSFAFDPAVSAPARFGPGLLWIAFLFSGALMLQSSFSKEQANDTLYALRLAPVSTFSIVLGKTLANLLFLLIAESILLPVFAVLYNVPLLPILGRLALIVLLGTLGMAVTGTVFSAVAAQARLRELLLPLLLFPILTPLLVAAVEATAGLLGETHALDRSWLAILIGFDVVFFTASWLLCDHLVEE